MRITKSNIEDELEKLAEKTDQTFKVDSWSAKDGSYHQLYIQNDDSSVSTIGSGMSTREMYHYLKGYREISREEEEWD